MLQAGSQIVFALVSIVIAILIVPGENDLTGVREIVATLPKPFDLATLMALWITIHNAVLGLAATTAFGNYCLLVLKTGGSFALLEASNMDIMSAMGILMHSKNNSRKASFLAIAVVFVVGLSSAADAFFQAVITDTVALSSKQETIYVRNTSLLDDDLYSTEPVTLIALNPKPNGYLLKSLGEVATAYDAAQKTFGSLALNQSTPLVTCPDQDGLPVDCVTTVLNFADYDINCATSKAPANTTVTFSMNSLLTLNFLPVAGNLSYTTGIKWQVSRAVRAVNTTIACNIVPVITKRTESKLRGTLDKQVVFTYDKPSTDPKNPTPYPQAYRKSSNGVPLPYYAFDYLATAMFHAFSSEAYIRTQPNTALSLYSSCQGILGSPAAPFNCVGQLGAFAASANNTLTDPPTEAEMRLMVERLMRYPVFNTPLEPLQCSDCVLKQHTVTKKPIFLAGMMLMDLAIIVLSVVSTVLARKGYEFENNLVTSVVMAGKHPETRKVLEQLDIHDGKQLEDLQFKTAIFFEPEGFKLDNVAKL
ncbi:hypothetical protein EDD86DRAFT_244310 [Gorgonomyces haynaldii]|nr:hypothetical protein EDD86DRAFT_244310 [Gorgonomyces haynaldii]